MIRSDAVTYIDKIFCERVFELKEGLNHVLEDCVGVSVTREAHVGLTCRRDSKGIDISMLPSDLQQLLERIKNRKFKLKAIDFCGRKVLVQLDNSSGGRFSSELHEIIVGWLHDRVAKQQAHAA